MEIIKIYAMQILDSRGNPTVEVEVILKDGSKGVFAVPSGASTGIHEAHELRDGDKNLFHGKSVMKVVKNIENLEKDLIGKQFTQESLDNYLIKIDGTENKKNLGANAILGISIAFSKACAEHYNLTNFDYLYRLANGINFSNKVQDNRKIPHLFANIINGGMHSGNALNLQEFMIVPIGTSMQESVKITSEVYQSLKGIIAEKFSKADTAVGDEGGFSPNISSVDEALTLVQTAIEQSNYSSQIKIALDCAATEFYNSETKKYEIEEGLFLNYKELSDFYNKICDKFPIISIEDPFSEDDFEGFAYYMKNSKTLAQTNPITGTNRVLVVGDDLLVTNPSRITIAKEKNLCNALLLKINQIGTLTESIKAHNMAKESGWQTIVSHRSGETCDNFIADLSVALESSIKLGAPARGERVAKYNRLLQIFNN